MRKQFIIINITINIISYCLNNKWAWTHKPTITWTVRQEVPRPYLFLMDRKSITPLTLPTYSPIWPRSPWVVQASWGWTQALTACLKPKKLQAQRIHRQKWTQTVSLLTSWGRCPEFSARDMSYSTFWARELTAESISQSILSHMIELQLNW